MPAWLRNVGVRHLLEWATIITLVTASILAMKGLDWLFGPWWMLVAVGGLFAVAVWLWTHPRQA
jgi:hypothetical protein